MGSIGLAIGNEKTDIVDIAMPTSTSHSASPGVVYPRCLRSNGCISVEKKLVYSVVNISISNVETSFLAHR